MNIGSAFPGSYLKADELGDARPIVIIDKVKMEDIGDDHKPVLYFQGKEKGLVLNKTNANMISELAGTPETDEWSGVRIRLYRTKVDFQGKRVAAIRVEAAPHNGAAGAAAAPAPVPAPPPPPPPARADYDDSDIPF